MNMKGLRRHGRATLAATLIVVIGGAGRAWPQSADNASLDGLSKELARLQQDVQRKNKEIGALLDAYQKQGGKLPEGFGPDLSDDQRKLLAQRFQQERLGLGSTLQDILDRDKEIAGLQKRIAEIQGGGQAPYSVTAKAGDTHMSLVRTFLQGRGVGASEVVRLLSSVSLHPTLVPGNRVWILYRSGQLGTWVTAGTARLDTRSPTMVTVPRNLTGPRDAVQRIRALELAVQQSEKERNELRKETATLRADIGHWAQEAEEMREVARASVQAARYLVGNKDELYEHGIISGNWFRGTRLHRLERLSMLDLTQAAEIVMSAADHGLQRIERVKLLPEGFQPDQDYAVYFGNDGAWARVALLDLDKFKASAFVVVLE
jgi:hypothetical protein